LKGFEIAKIKCKYNAKLPTNNVYYHRGCVTYESPGGDIRVIPL